MIQGVDRSSITSSTAFGSVMSSPADQQDGHGPAADDADELPGVPPPGQHFQPPSPSFQRAAPPPPPPTGVHPPPPQFQAEQQPQQPQQPPQQPPQQQKRDHDLWQQPSWHSSDAPGGHPPQLHPPPPPSGGGGRSPSPLQQQDSLASPTARQHESSPFLEARPSLSPGFPLYTCLCQRAVTSCTTMLLSPKRHL